MPTNKYYIYKYVVNNQIVYIGQTINLPGRIAQHKKDKLRDIQATIYYFECPNKTAMNSWEYFLINKYHPIYNTALNDINITIYAEEPKWIKYTNKDNLVSNKKKEEELSQERKNKEINLNLLFENKTIKEKIINSQEINIKHNFCEIPMMEQRLLLYLLIKSKINNTPLLETLGTTIEFIHFTGITESGNCYRDVNKILSNTVNLKTIEKNNFHLTSIGEEILINFQDLDLEFLANLIKYCTSKYTCFILDALFQTDDLILSIENLQRYLPSSYSTNYNSLYKRVILPALEDCKKINFILGYTPIKQGKRFVAINFS